MFRRWSKPDLPGPAWTSTNLPGASLDLPGINADSLPLSLSLVVVHPPSPVSLLAAAPGDEHGEDQDEAANCLGMKLETYGTFSFVDWPG